MVGIGTRWLVTLCMLSAVQCVPSRVTHQSNTDSEDSRKVLGSSVVTSVSVIMDHGNGTKTYLSDGQSKNVQKQSETLIGSPGHLLSPDRYEFYTFDETGDLVKRLMTLDEIHGLIAGADPESDLTDVSPTYYHDALSSHSSEALMHLPATDLESLDAPAVHKVLEKVQNVLKTEMAANSGNPLTSISDIPLHHQETSSAWSALFPGLIETPDDVAHLSGYLLPSKIAESATKTSLKKPISITKQPHTTTTHKFSTNKLSLSTTAYPSVIITETSKSTPKYTTNTPPEVISKLTPIQTSTFKSSTTKKPFKPIQSFDKEKPTISNPTLTLKPTDKLSAMVADNLNINKEMSASISNMLSQVTDSHSINNSPIQSNTLIDKENTADYLPEESSPELSYYNPAEISLSTVTSLKPVAESLTTAKKHYTTVSSKSTTTEIPFLQKNPSITKFVPNKFNLTKLRPPTNFTVSSVVTKAPPPSFNNKYNGSSIQATTVSSVRNNYHYPPSNMSTKYMQKITQTTQVYPNITNNNFINSTEKPINNIHHFSTKQPSNNNFNTTEKVQNKLKESNDTNWSSTEGFKNYSIISWSTDGYKNKFKEPSVTTASTIEFKTTLKEPNKVFANKLSSSTRPNLINRPNVTLSNRIQEHKITTLSYGSTINSTTIKSPSESDEYISVKADPWPTTTTLPTVTTLNTPYVSSTPKSFSSSSSLPFNSIPDTNTIKELISSLMTTSTVSNISSVSNLSATSEAEQKTTYITSTTTVAYQKNASEMPLPIASSTTQLPTTLTTTSTVVPIITSASTTTEAITTPHVLPSSLKENLVMNNTKATLGTSFTSTTSESEIQYVPVTHFLQEIQTNRSPEFEKNTSSTLGVDSLLKDGITAVTNMLQNTQKPTIMNTDHQLISSSSYENTTIKITKPPSTEQARTQTTTPLETEDVSSVTTESLTPQESYEMTTTEINTKLPVLKDTVAMESVTDNSNHDLFRISEQGLEMLTIFNVSSTGVPVQAGKLADLPAESPVVFDSTISYENHSIEPSTNIEEILTTARAVVSSSTIASNESDLNQTKQVLVENVKATLLPENYTTQLPLLTTTLQNIKLPSFSSNVYRPLSNGVSPSTVELHPAPHESMGLEASVAFLGDDVRRFVDLCNELSFKMWTTITGKGLIASRSLVLSPFELTAMLAMVFLGARGSTSGQMNDVLRLDDMVTFNPHQVLRNVTQSITDTNIPGVATASFVREIYSHKENGKILDFYKERVQQYYDGHVEEVDFNTIGDILRRRTNLLVKRQTLGRVVEYLRGSSLSLTPPFAAFSANVFQTSCETASTDGRDGEMYFVVRPSTRQRRLVPIPAAVWKNGFLAGYEPGLDATAVSLSPDSIVSTILILPGQQGQVAPGDGLTRLEQRLIETSYRRGGWSRILRSLLPRPGLELQIPRFSHRSVLNTTIALQKMGLKEVFNGQKADLRGVNGLYDLYLSDMLQVNTFSTCGEDVIGARHHVETYPASPQRMGRIERLAEKKRRKRYANSAVDYFQNPYSHLPLNLRPRQARLPDSPRLRFDRPFLYLVRHNPTGMILYLGRFNPRLLP
ncbi:uncharacterized protein LOC126908597 [Daktulosphaira vitifoliae]|uniref:uncharacterized protein LOC126908597 n=1 Tax=Daktulosphaira vitifoliae TaxID=58002 RepID=UPI0021AAD666|nr:uncharacterized protein LOC126908597 [Daktulosphaira vitifoliae]XP_050546769.1 uncharacterized protein LOC126908597 [Daktulosphaira vitifoliae]